MSFGRKFMAPRARRTDLGNQRLLDGKLHMIPPHDRCCPRFFAQGRSIFVSISIYSTIWRDDREERVRVGPCLIRKERPADRLVPAVTSRLAIAKAPVRIWARTEPRSLGLPARHSGVDVCGRSAGLKDRLHRLGIGR